MNIKAVTGMLGSNTFIVEKNNTVIIIDAGATVQDVQKALGTKKPMAVLLTHEHYDHVINAAGYCDAFGCPVYGHAATVAELISGELNGFLNPFGDVPATPSILRELEIGATQIGSINIEVIGCEGHSAGSIIFKIDDTIFTGDVLFKQGIGRTDLHENGPELTKITLQNLLNVTFKTAYHGHGPSSDYSAQQKNIRDYINLL